MADALSLPSAPVMTDALRALGASALRVSRTPGPRRRASSKAKREPVSKAKREPVSKAKREPVVKLRERALGASALRVSPTLGAQFTRLSCYLLSLLAFLRVSRPLKVLSLLN